MCSTAGSHGSSSRRPTRSTVYLSVPTRFLKSWILSHYYERLLALWKDERGGRASASRSSCAAPSGAKAAGTDSEDNGRRAAAAPPAHHFPRCRRRRAGRTPEGHLSGSPVDRRYTFETFCEGAANRVAFAAARAVAEAEPGKPNRFNPLYIHAGVGRGKTHLLHATTRAARRAEPARKVVYLTAEHFMFRFVAALRNQSAIPFKESLRDIDLLLIDDMQFLQGKSVQQEFCHMLNALIDGARQVVVAADRPPAELESLDERVRSRLKGGVAFEIGAPGPRLCAAGSSPGATTSPRTTIPASTSPSRCSNMSPSRWSRTAVTLKARSTASSPSGSSPTRR